MIERNLEFSFNNEIGYLAQTYRRFSKAIESLVSIMLKFFSQFARLANPKNADIGGLIIFRILTGGFT